MKRFLILIIVNFLAYSLHAQLVCDMIKYDTLLQEKSQMLVGSSCNDISSYSLYPNPDHTPIKTIRIAFDILQKSDGSGNFNGSNASITSMFVELIDSANLRLENIKPHNPSLSSPYIPDSKIQLSLNNVYFYTNDDLYNYGLRGEARAVADSIYHNIIKNRSDLNEIDKEHTLHVVMIPGGLACCGGQASGFANKEWIVMKGYDYSFNWATSPIHEVVGHFIHEVGHSLGLFHSFADSDCGTFTEKTTNNYMDYTPPRMANCYSLSDCQISKVHYCLMGGGTLVYRDYSYRVGGVKIYKSWVNNISDDYIQDFCSFFNQKSISIISGENITWNSSKNLIGNLNINNGGTLTINCNISIPKDGQVYVNSGGKLILNEGDFDNKCFDFWKGITVENGGYLLLKNANLDDYSITVKSGGTLRISDNLILSNNCNINVENGGYICFDIASVISLLNYNNVINLHTGYILGVNTAYVLSPGTCNSNLVSINKSGNGSINTFANDIYIQNENILTDRYYAGNNIFVGSNVNPSLPTGPVIIKSGKTVIFNAEGNVILDKGFETELLNGVSGMFDVVK